MFKLFKEQVQAQFEKMAKHKLYRVMGDKDKLWETYLSSFPEGTNPLYKERTEHDCNCCKSFIRAVGGIVAIIDGKVVSLWDVEGAGATYQPVADALSALVKSCAITDIFLHSEPAAGVDVTRDLLDKKLVRWEHFYVKLPKAVVVKGESIGTLLGAARDTRNVMLRSLREITDDAIDTVLELIAQNSLYRGEEHKFAVESFHGIKKDFGKLSEKEQELFCWSMYDSVPASVSKIRNTAIGTLLTDISEGVDLDKAVASFESKVAPTNYKRPTAVITKGMIETAQKTINDLGLLSALDRRYAVLSDITANNVLFADRSAKPLMKDVFDELSASVRTDVKKFDQVEQMNIEQFLTNVVPKADSIEVLVENCHAGNFVSLVAPVNPDAGSLFKWDNNFSWAYHGGIADSMRERVASLGGRVDGALRFTHSWNHTEVGRNASLMDLHVFMPGSDGHKHKDGCHDIYPSGPRVGWNRRNDSKSGGTQDVDHVDAAAEGFIPVENISFPDIKRMPEGDYFFKIHNWSFRNPTTSGGKAEIEFAGQIFTYDYPAALKNKEWVSLAKVNLKNGVFTIEHMMKCGESQRTIWGIPTQTFHKVNLMMLSPNHWNGHGVGNKHYFFMLDGCAQEGSARGFFNEFLRGDLDQHRKVFEIVGSKMKTAESTDQLSGLGFSSTQRNSVKVRVKGAISRVLEITF